MGVLCTRAPSHICEWFKLYLLLIKGNEGQCLVGTWREVTNCGIGGTTCHPPSICGMVTIVGPIVEGLSHPSGYCGTTIGVVLAIGIKALGHPNVYCGNASHVWSWVKGGGHLGSWQLLWYNINWQACCGSCRMCRHWPIWRHGLVWRRPLNHFLELWVQFHCYPKTWKMGPWRC